MKCSICGHDARTGSANCSRCGAPLAQPGPSHLDDRTVLRTATSALAAPEVPAQPPAPSAGNPYGLNLAEPALATPAPVYQPGPPAVADQWQVLPSAPPAPAAPLLPAPVVQRSVVVVGRPKSVAVALLLTFFFGPFGMFYSTVMGAVIMLVATIALALLTGGLSVWVTGPICMIWGAVAVKSANDKVMEQVRSW